MGKWKHWLTVAVLLLVLSCGGDNAITEGTSTIAPELASKYQAAGEKLDSARSPSKKWGDGSNWQDGRSHEPPPLPLPPETEILDGMTCAQWEALEMAVFPESDNYTVSNWHRQPNSSKIGDQWRSNLAEAIWGDLPQADNWMEENNFLEDCGSLMR